MLQTVQWFYRWQNKDPKSGGSFVSTNDDNINPVLADHSLNIRNIAEELGISIGT